MTVRKRGKKWQYDFYHEDKRYRKGGFDTKREAVAAENEHMNQLNKGVDINNDVVFATYFDMWYKLNKKTVHPNTFSWYRITHKWIIEYFGAKKIKDISRLDYQAFIDWYGLESKNGNTKIIGHSKGAVKQTHSHIKSCVQDALFDGLIFRDFTHKVKLNHKIESKADVDKYLNYEDYAKLKKATLKDKTVHNFFIYMAIITGGRYSDITNMEYDHINTLNQSIYLNGTKTDTAPRTVKVTAKDVKEVQQFISSLPRNMNGFIFRDRGSSIKAGTMNYYLRKLSKELKIKEVSFHGLRHTHCSLLIFKDVSIYYISKRLGHKNVNTTMRVYSHLIKEKEDIEEEKALKALATL